MTTGICLLYLRLARVRAEIRDETYASTSTALDWSWADHNVDGEPPLFFGIDRPNYTIGTGDVATSGYAYDPSGVSSVTLEIQTPNSGTRTVVCPDAAPRDGVWSCAWNATQ